MNDFQLSNLLTFSPFYRNPAFIRKIGGEIKKITPYIKGYTKVMFSDVSWYWYRMQLWYLLSLVKNIKILPYYNGKVEIASIVSRDDLLLYLIMIKTFTFFSSRSFMFTVYEDGSFSENDKQILMNFVPSCRLISKPDADKKNSTVSKRLSGTYTSITQVCNLSSSVYTHLICFAASSSCKPE